MEVVLLRSDGDAGDCFSKTVSEDNKKQRGGSALMEDNVVVVQRWGSDTMVMAQLLGTAHQPWYLQCCVPLVEVPSVVPRRSTTSGMTSR